MKTLSKLGLTVAIATALSTVAQAQISYTGGVFSENFDSMGVAGTTTPAGFFAGTGTGAAVTTTAVIAGGQAAVPQAVTIILASPALIPTRIVLWVP